MIPLELDVDIESPQELNHSSYVVAGLFDLEHAGIVRRVRLATNFSLHRGEIHVAADGSLLRTEVRASKTVFLTLRTGNRSLRIAIDFRDASFVFPQYAARTADILFKRSFNRKLADAVSRDYSTPILPAGLSFCARSSFQRARGRLTANFALLSVLDATRADSALIERWKRTWHSVRRQIAFADLQHPFTADLKPARSSTSSPSIFFQTRTFPRTDDADVAQLHTERANLIRALKRQFGSRFIGGFVPDPISRERYPDCISTVGSDKQAYFEAMQQATIVIYSRGLLRSTAWKLSEYLAFGKCIVAERIASELPEPLADGEQIAEFDSPERCILTCQTLLGDPSKRRAMEESARSYYEKSVDPAAGVLRMLQTALAAAT